MNTTADHVYRAEILSMAVDDNRARAERLFASPGIDRLDTLEAQVADLVKTRHPGRQLAKAEVDDEVARFLAAHGGDRYGVWVHYPWSRRLVRLLAEAEFVELRTDRNKHKITDAEQAMLARRRIGIVGLSVGQSVALTMAMERVCSQLRLADFDTIDLSNLNRLRCGVHNLGIHKTIAAAREIAELDPYLDVICFDQGYTDQNANDFIDGLDLVVDECDSIDVKVTLREAARARGIPVLMSTSDRGTVDIERFDLEPQRPLFHGRLGRLSVSDLANLTTEQKIPILITLANLPKASARLRASLMEIGQSIKTWPQLASDVTFGGAAICDVARRTLLGQAVASGCYRMDFDQLGNPAHVLSEDPEPPAQWQPRPQDSAVDVKDAILLDAIQAPSAGNTQPWRWRKTDDGLSLSRRETHAGSVLYAGGRADHVALRATLETAIISARQHGFDVVEHPVPRPGDIATLTLRPGGGPEPLHDQITRRRSVRDRAAERRHLPDGSLNRLGAAIGNHPQLRLDWLTTESQLSEVAELIGEAERLRFLDPTSHAELTSRELCWSDEEHAAKREGIPMSSLALSGQEIAALHLLRDADVASTLAACNGGEGLRTLSRDMVVSSSAMGLLWSQHDTPATFIDGGRAMQRLWLQATQDDIGLCPMTTLCYLISAWRDGCLATDLQREVVPALERRLRSVFGLPDRHVGLMLFRALPADGQFSAQRRTLRLPLHDVSGPA